MASPESIYAKIDAMPDLTTASIRKLHRWIKDGELTLYSVVSHGKDVKLTAGLLKLSDVQKLTGEWRER